MIDFSELIVFIVGIVTLVVILKDKKDVELLPDYRLFIFSFYLVLGGWFFTIVEGFFLHDFFNLIEHVLYATSNIFLASWCYVVFRRRPKG